VYVYAPTYPCPVLTDINTPAVQEEVPPIHTGDDYIAIQIIAKKPVFLRSVLRLLVTANVLSSPILATLIM
jgi:hypothetical protein